MTRITIRMLGRPAIEDQEDGADRPVRGHLSWALLARILLTRRPPSRHDIALELFAETADPLGLVRWGLAALRRAIGPETFREALVHLPG